MTTGEYLKYRSSLPLGTALDHFQSMTGSGDIINISMEETPFGIEKETFKFSIREFENPFTVVERAVRFYDNTLEVPFRINNELIKFSRILHD